MTLRKSALTSSENVGPDTPLRLSVAAAIAFPDQSISESSLRREAKRGRLTVEIIAGKTFTTLNEIERMRGRCRVEVRVPVSTSDQPAIGPESSPIKPLGLFGTARDITPLDALTAKLQRLSKSSRTISQKNTLRRARNKT